jgi:hypothetical protein
MRLRPENGEYEEIMVSADEVRLQGRVVYMVHSPRRGPHDSVSSAAEELMAAREYVSRTGPFDGAPAKRIGRILDDLEEY